MVELCFYSGFKLYIMLIVSRLLEADGSNEFLNLGDVGLLCVFLGDSALLAPCLELGFTFQVEEAGGF